MSSSDSSIHGHLPTAFRRLQRNDTEQTNDQWKQNLLRETGTIAPLWTSYARSNQEPVIGMPRPREPLKPSDPDIMAEQKLIYRQAIANTQGIPLAEVPPCSALVVWENYQIRRPIGHVQAKGEGSQRGLPPRES